MATVVFMSVPRWAAVSDRVSQGSNFWKLNRLMAEGPHLINKNRFSFKFFMTLHDNIIHFETGPNVCFLPHKIRT